MIFKRPARRHGVSKRVYVLAWLSIIGWVCFIAALIVFHYARPEQEYGMLKFLGVDVRTTWISDLSVWYELLLYSCAGISLLSLFINRSRVKEPHRVRYNMVLLLFISVAMLISYFVTT